MGGSQRNVPPLRKSDTATWVRKLRRPWERLGSLFAPSSKEGARFDVVLVLFFDVAVMPFGRARGSSAEGLIDSRLYDLSIFSLLVTLPFLKDVGLAITLDLGSCLRVATWCLGVCENLRKG